MLAPQGPSKQLGLLDSRLKTETFLSTEPHLFCRSCHRPFPAGRGNFPDVNILYRHAPEVLVIM